MKINGINYGNLLSQMAIRPEPPAQQPSKVDTVLKYSGVAAFALVPVTAFITHKSMTKAIKAMQESHAQQIKILTDIKTNITASQTAKSTSLEGLTPAVAGVGAGLFIAGQKTQKVSENTVEKLETEATKRIRGEYPWKNVQNIQGWMVSAETQTFMKVGGLAEVAVQLPDAFNKKYADDPKNRLDIITPLYTGTGAKSAKLEQINGKFLYTGAEKNQIELTKTGSFNMKVHNGNRFKDETVDILSGELNGTKYVFLKNDKYFDITPHRNNNPVCQGAYVYNQNEIGEVERMVFFSKAVYEMMKQVKDKPTTLIANDWHASAISTAMRYVNTIELENNKITKATAQAINDIPVIHITHNNAYQGLETVPEVSDRITKTLLGENTDKYINYIKGYNGHGFPLSDGYGTFNETKSDTYLADRIIAVSPNYAKELCTKSLGADLEDLSKIRKDHNTLDGIVNGYTKSLAIPDTKMIQNINKGLNTHFIPYDENGYEDKLQNKTAMLEVLNTLAKTNEMPTGITLYKPEECEIPHKAFDKVPVITSIGRYVEQKGFDYLAQSVVKMYQNLPKDAEKPVIAVLGSGDPQVTKLLNSIKDQVALFDKEAAKRIFIFNGFNPAMRDALGIASDFFLIPSKWEPCGLTQMEAMPKGALPVATATGGLVDTIEDGKDGFVTDVFYGFNSGEKLYDNGKSKHKTNAEAFTATLNRALETFYKSPEKIREMAINAMIKDFSWDVPGGPLEKYEKLFKTGSIA